MYSLKTITCTYSSDSHEKLITRTTSRENIGSKEPSAINYSYLNLKIWPVFYVEFLTRRTQFKQYRMRQLIAFDEGERMLILSLRVITRVSRVWLYEIAEIYRTVNSLTLCFLCIHHRNFPSIHESF